MTRTPRARGAAQPTHRFAKDDRVRVRAGVTGGVAEGDEGVVRSVLPLSCQRPIRVALDGDEGEPRGFEVDELELVRAARR